jgi:hypothetical protein
MDYEALIAQKDAAIAQKDAKIAQQAARIDELSNLIAQLQKQVFGPKSERYIPTVDPGQLNIFGDADQEESLNSSSQSDKETIIL